MSTRSECLKKCLKARTAWYVGGGIIATLVTVLVGLGVIIPAAGTLLAILIGIGLAAFVSVAAVIYCLNKC